MLEDKEIEISIVSPVYRAESIIPELVRRIDAEVSKITTSFEIILVEDGSPDDSWREIEKQAKLNSKVKGFSLSRNFGQHYAIAAGLVQVKGKWVVVMDCDLQDRPEEIAALYTKAKEGFDIVLASRVKRQDSFLKKLSSRVFYSTLSFLSGTEQDYTVANFGIYHHKVIDSINKMPEQIRYFPTMVRWVGFKRTKLNVQHDERSEGETTYTFGKLVKLASDIILANSKGLMRLMIKMGFLMSLVAFGIGLYYLWQYISGDIVVMGFASLIISLWFIGGIVMLSLGLLGIYLGKVFDGVNSRPTFIIKKSTLE
jgi:polyisoprenyl-phosphate glycosyltransferase